MVPGVLVSTLSTVNLSTKYFALTLVNHAYQILVLIRLGVQQLSPQEYPFLGDSIGSSRPHRAMDRFGVYIQITKRGSDSESVTNSPDLMSTPLEVVQEVPYSLDSRQPVVVYQTQTVR